MGLVSFASRLKISDFMKNKFHGCTAITKITNSSQETFALGRDFSRSLKEKDVVILEGALGGGKTTFAKGVWEGLKIKRGVRLNRRTKEEVLSPTYTLMRIYRLRGFSLYHLDLYRINREELFPLALEEYFYAPRSVSLIEWGERIEKRLPVYRKVRFFFKGENGRKIIFSSKGVR